MHILLVDDDKSIAQMSASYLMQNVKNLPSPLQVSATFGLDSAFSIIESQLDICLVMLDLGVDRLPGSEVVKVFCNKSPRQLPLAVYTGHRPSTTNPLAAQIFHECFFKYNVKGFLLKEVGVENIIYGLERMLLADERYVPIAVVESVMTVQAKDPLTPREWSVARGISQGKSTKEIAKELKIAPGYVGQLTTEVFRKLEVENRTLCAIKVNSMLSSPR